MFLPAKHRHAWKYAWIMALFWAASVLTSHAQQGQYVFSHLTAENGLMNNHVHSLCQDSRGYMWFGHINGLQRYDGSKFVNYTADLHDPEALHYSWIDMIFEDSKQRLWICANEIYQLNRATGKFYNYNLHVLPGKPTMDGVGKIMEDNNGDIWIWNRNSYFKLNDKTNQFEDCGYMAGLTPGEHPSLMDKDERGNLWFVTIKGIKCYNKSSKKIVDVNNNPAQLKIFENKGAVTSFKIDHDRIWLSFEWSRVLYEYDIISNLLTHHPLKDIEKERSRAGGLIIKIESIGITHDKKISLVLPGEGIAFYNPADNSFREIVIDNKDPNGLHSSLEKFEGISFFEDREGNDWVSSDKGLNIFNPGKKYFSFYGSNVNGNTTHLPAYPVNGFLQDSVTHSIYVAYYYPDGGMVKLDKDLQFQKQYLWQHKGKGSNENQIWTLFMDDHGVIWAPNQAKSILQLDTKTDQLSLVDDSALHGYYTCIQKDNTGNIWMGGWLVGLKKIDESRHTINTFLDPPVGSSLIPKSILCLHFEGDSIIWAGSNEAGLFRFDKRKNKYTDCYFFDGKDPRSISNNTIKRILYYNQDTLLLATNMGLDFFNVKKRTFSHLSAKDGLPGNVVESIDIDDQKNIWAACDGGLCKIRLYPFTITRYGLGDGITDDIFYNVPFLKTLEGWTLVATSQGFTAFRASDIITAHSPPAPVITGFRVLDKTINTDSLVNTQVPLVLSYKKNTITIEFSSMLFNTAGQLKYYYMLEGADDAWVPATNELTAHYNQLTSGHYIFRVKCVNRDGLTSVKETTLRIFIRPPFWKTGWFIATISILTVLAVFRFIKWRENNIRTIASGKLKIQQAQTAMHSINEQLSRAKLEALRSQMNPHFIFNSLNAIQECIVTNKIDAAYEYLSKFSKLQRMVLADSAKELIPVRNEIEMLQLYLSLESLRFSQSFSFHIDVSGMTDMDEVFIPSLITQPFVENAVWHGLRNKEGEKKLFITFSDIDGFLTIRIDDNGVGREKAGEIKAQKMNTGSYESRGSEMALSRIALLNQQYNINIEIGYIDKKDDDGEAAGTIVIINIPNNLSPLYKQA